MRLSFSIVPLFIFLSLLLRAQDAAGAAGPPGRSLVVYAEGTDAARVREVIAGAIGDQVRLVDPATFVAAVRREGQRLPLGPALVAGKGRLLGALRNAATASGVDAVLAAWAVRRGAALFVTMTWLDPRSPVPALRRAVLLRADAGANRAAVAASLGEHLAAFAAGAGSAPDRGPPTAPAGADAGSAAARPAAARPAVAPPPVATPAASQTNPQDPAAAAVLPDPPPPASPRPQRAARRRHDMRTALLVADLALDFGGRRFSYNDLLTPALADYTVFGVPVPALALSVYPAAGTGVPVLRDLGLTLRVARAFGLSSATLNGTTAGTEWTQVSGGLRARYAPARFARLLLGVGLGVDYNQFSFDAQGDLARIVPGVRYLSLRAGLDARLRFWRLALLLGFGYHGNLQAGEVADRFRGPSVGGIDLDVGLAWVLPAGFEVRVHGGYLRYFYSFHPVPGDDNVAGGALDEFVNFGAGVTYAF